MYAGSVLITPATLWSHSALHEVISASPPKHTTVPASISSSVVYFSAKSAYFADVAVPSKLTAKTWLYLKDPLPKSSVLSALGVIVPL